MEDAKSILKNKISSIEKRLLEKLNETRETYKHSGTKGDKIERSFRDFLSDHLPRKLGVGNGEIIDLKGSRSFQTDVIITNENHPPIFSIYEPNILSLFLKISMIFSLIYTIILRGLYHF